MPRETTVWVDSKGEYWPTEREAIAADSKYQEEKELTDVVTLLQTKSRELGFTGLPKSVTDGARIAIAVYPDLKQYYGD